MFIGSFKNYFLPYQKRHNANIFVGTQTSAAQPKRQYQQKKIVKKMNTKSSGDGTVPTMLALLVVCVCSNNILHVTSAMPLQMLLMYTSPTSNEGADHLLFFPLQRRYSSAELDLFRQRQQQQHQLLANAFLSNNDVVQPMDGDDDDDDGALLMSTSNSNNHNSNPYTFVMKRIASPPPYVANNANEAAAPPATAFDQRKTEEESERAPAGQQRQEEQNLLRAGRNIEENSAPKMYARHLGDLGGTMFRFG